MTLALQSCFFIEFFQSSLTSLVVKTIFWQGKLFPIDGLMQKLIFSLFFFIFFYPFVILFVNKPVKKYGKHERMSDVTMDLKCAAVSI